MTHLLFLGDNGVFGLTQTHSTTLPDVSVGHVLGQTVIALIVIVGSVWALGKVYARKRSGQLKRRTPQTPDGLRILSRQTLGKDQQLAVVMWGDRKILIGISGSNISFFNDGVVDDASIASAIAPSTAQESESSPYGVIETYPDSNSLDPFFGLNIPNPEPQKSLIERLRDVTQRN